MDINMFIVTHCHVYADVYRYPDAKFTLIYSHGNATDCGAMFIMYAMLAMTLKINVVGYDYTGIYMYMYMYKNVFVYAEISRINIYILILIMYAMLAMTLKINVVGYDYTGIYKYICLNK
jgi:hypothetical protein